jgi:hypothetical protein
MLALLAIAILVVVVVAEASRDLTYSGRSLG